MATIAVIGAGSWGTALALHLGRLGHDVRLWVRREDLASEIGRTRENRYYLPGFPLPANVRIETDLGGAAGGAGTVISAVPSHTVRAMLLRLAGHVSERTAVLSASKGIEAESCLLMSDVIVQVLGSAARSRVGVLSGPTFALDVARGDPTAAVVACHDPGLARLFQTEISGRNLRLYTNDDPIGTQIGGAVKNIIAIAAGIAHGLGLGASSAAALVTRGLAEVKRLCLASGGRAETLSGLAGLGDLVLTSTGALSRNRSVGIELGRGRTLGEIQAASRFVAEGVITTRSAFDLAARLRVEMPITAQMEAVLYRSKPPLEAIRDLMERELKSEF